jgi:uncharacterized small protein (DUF1192 family)
MLHCRRYKFTDWRSALDSMLSQLQLRRARKCDTTLQHRFSRQRPFCNRMGNLPVKHGTHKRKLLDAELYDQSNTLYPLFPALEKARDDRDAEKKKTGELVQKQIQLMTPIKARIAILEDKLTRCQNRTQRKHVRAAAAEATVRSLEADVVELREAADVLVRCVACLVLPRQIIFMPCGHFITCKQCAKACSVKGDCPNCRVTIDELKPGFM